MLPTNRTGPRSPCRRLWGLPPPSLLTSRALPQVSPVTPRFCLVPARCSRTARWRLVVGHRSFDPAIRKNGEAERYIRRGHVSTKVQGGEALRIFLQQPYIWRAYAPVCREVEARISRVRWIFSRNGPYLHPLYPGGFPRSVRMTATGSIPRSSGHRAFAGVQALPAARRSVPARTHTPKTRQSSWHAESTKLF